MVKYMGCCCSSLRQGKYSSKSSRSIRLNKNAVGTVEKNVQCKTLDQILDEKTKEELKEQQIQQLKQCEEADKNFSTTVTKNEQENDCDWPRASTSSVFDCDWEYFSNYVSLSLQ